MSGVGLGVGVGVGRHSRGQARRFQTGPRLY